MKMRMNMGRRRIQSSWGSISMGVVRLGVIAFAIGCSCSVSYIVMSASGVLIKSKWKPKTMNNDLDLDCCRGIPKLELWGSAVKWGTDHKLSTQQQCCQSCKDMCKDEDEDEDEDSNSCLCDTWVFCGDKKACRHQFGECWLKKQIDPLAPQRQDAGSNVMWTSGLIFPKRQGIIGLETEHGTLHIKLHPDSAPYSVEYILELLTLRHCAGCQFYRAEGRGNSWDTKGNHIEDASFGPPFALIQGTLEAAGTSFKKISSEVCRSVRRGAVAWVGSGPEFFISLANHVEWKQAYTVFGSVLPEDMEIVEKIAKLPTKPDVWNNIDISVLERSIPISIRRIPSNREDNTH